MASGRGRVSPLALVPVLAFVVLYWAIDARRDLPAWLPLAYVGISIVTLVVYGVDKRAAVGHRHRVSETALILLGFIGGWPGAVIAQQLFRHKTTKRSFVVRFWISVILHVLVFIVVTVGVLPL